MKVLLASLVSGLLLATAGLCAAETGRDAELKKNIVGIWKDDREGDMVMQFAGDGTVKFMPLDPEAIKGGFLSLKWTLQPGGKLKLGGLPDGDEGEVGVRIEGDLMRFMDGDQVEATFRRLKELPEALRTAKPAAEDLLAAARDKALMVKMASDGRQIFMAHTVLELEGEDAPANPVYPGSGTSTEHFRVMAMRPGSPLSAALLGGPGLPAAAAADRIKADNVAWLMLADAGTASSKLPLFLSRNVKAGKVSDLKGRISDTLADRPPFGRKAAVIVFKDGSVRIVSGATLDTTWDTLLGERKPGEPDRTYLQP